MKEYVYDKVLPDKKSKLDKKQQVSAMFDTIAFRYDFLNRFLSAGIDKRWRKKAIKELISSHPKIILDVATGTADVAFMSYKILHPEKIFGIDISEAMLEIGRQKINKANLNDIIELKTGDSEKIAFPDNYFDAVTVAFGVRNFQHLEKGLNEMLRVLKVGGKLVVLEFSKPTNSFFKIFYNFYMNFIISFAGKVFAKNRNAYTYLNESVQAFPEREIFASIMENCGFTNVYFKPLSFGICCIYCGVK